jgi:hypothetical protein
MHVDMTLWPTTLAAGHALLAALVILLLVSQVLLLTVTAIGALRRDRTAVAAVAGSAVKPPLPPETETVPASTLKPTVSALREAASDSALQLLGLLQNEARFVDFVQESVTSFTDAEIGAAARIVHEGCRRVIHQHFELEPVRKETENSRLSIPKGFDPASIRLTGNIVGQAPFAGTLVHRGWRVTQVKLPKLAEGHDTQVIAPAEVEL